MAEQEVEGSEFTIDPPIDSDEVFARLRFSLDDDAVAARDHRPPSEQRRLEERHRLRSSSVIVTPRLMPRIHRVIEEVCERLRIATLPEVMIRSDPTPNASLLADGGPPLVVLQSGLLTLLDTDELAAVLGHELAHWGLRHRAPIDERDPDLETALRRDALRAAEVSADRVGMAAARDFRTALRAEIKLACGLGAQYLALDDLDAFIEQLDADMGTTDRQWEVLATHPELHFRFWAQHRFSQTDLFRSVVGLPGGTPFMGIEAEIEERFLALGGGVAFRVASDCVHEALAWISTLLVAEDGEIDEREHAQLVQLVGMVWADDATAYARRHGLDAVRRRAEESLRPLRLARRQTHVRIKAAIERFSAAIGLEESRREEALEFVRGVLRG
jgi:hypothetical protein